MNDDPNAAHLKRMRDLMTSALDVYIEGDVDAAGDPGMLLMGGLIEVHNTVSTVTGGLTACQIVNGMAAYVATIIALLETEYCGEASGSHTARTAAMIEVSSAIGRSLRQMPVGNRVSEANAIRPNKEAS